MEKCCKSDYKKKIEWLLKTLKGEQVDICAEIYRCIISAPENQAELFQFFLEISEDIDSAGDEEARQVFTRGECLDYRDRYGKIVDGILEKILLQRKKANEFYEELWKLINSEDFFDTEKSRIFALYYVWIDARIPYYELKDGLSIDKETYVATAQKISEKIRHARFILCCGLKKWTQVSSLLCELLDETENEIEKAVLLATIMQLYNHMFGDGELLDESGKEKETEEEPADSIK